MKHHKHRIILLNVTRTDNLGESREEAKKLLEEVEAMEREAHQVFRERYLWWSLLSFFSLFMESSIHLLIAYFLCPGVRQMYESRKSLPGFRHNKEPTQVIQACDLDQGVCLRLWSLS